VVTNVGPNGASGVVLSNALPGGLNLVSAAVTQGSVTEEDGMIRAELGELAAGSAATLTLELRADQLGLWTNAAIVSAAEFDPELTNNNARVVTEVKLDTDLTVSLSATPHPVLVQSLSTYTIEITNQGPHTATAVRLADELPGAVNFVSLQTSQGTGTNDSGTVKCELGDLPAGSHALVTIVVRPTALGLLTNGNLDVLRYLAPIYDLYKQRIAQFQIEPPPENWDGVFALQEK